MHAVLVALRAFPMETYYTVHCAVSIATRPFSPYHGRVRARVCELRVSIRGVAAVVVCCHMIDYVYADVCFRLLNAPQHCRSHPCIRVRACACV